LTKQGLQTKLSDTIDHAIHATNRRGVKTEHNPLMTGPKCGVPSNVGVVNLCDLIGITALGGNKSSARVEQLILMFLSGSCTHFRVTKALLRDVDVILVGYKSDER
jgi:hypothetical protein